MTSNTDIQKIKIIKERTNIFKEFTLNLLENICEFYLDKDTLNNDKDINNHFNWCFIKTCDKFVLDGYKFHYNESLKSYFYAYYYDVIYKSLKFDTKEKITKEVFEEYWKKTFDISTTKDKNIIAILAQIYKIFDKSMNNMSNLIITENNIILENEKNKSLSINIDVHKFNKIYEFKYANNTIALGELINGNFIFIDKDGNENINNITDEEIGNMDNYIRGIYFNQMIGSKTFYTISQFSYSNNKLAQAETIKGKSVYINKLGELVKYSTKNK